MINSERLFWICMGILGGVVINLAINTSIIILYTNEILYKYQTIISGALALSGVIVTVIVILYQISRNMRIELEKSEKRHQASRAMLPLALTKVCQYSRECINYLIEIGIKNEGMKFIDEKTIGDMPIIDTSTLNMLRDCVEFVDDKNAKKISTLIARIQIQNSRISSLKDETININRIITINDLNQGIVDSVELDVRAAPLFTYARGDDWSPQEGIGMKEMHDRIQGYELSKDNYEGVHDIIRRIYS